MTNAAGLLSPDELLVRRRALAVKLRRLRLQAHPRLSQQAAASYIGLSDSTGYRSIGQWESGDVQPSSSWRPTLRRYLWCALGLHAHPAEFAALWQEIAVAWEWPDLSEADWMELRSLSCAPAATGVVQRSDASSGEQSLTATASIHPPDLMPLIRPPVDMHASAPSALADSAPAATGTAVTDTGATGTAATGTAPSAALPGWVPRRLLPAGLFAAFCALLFLLLSALASHGSLPTSPLRVAGTAAVYANLGFESAQGLAPWTVVGDPACARRLAATTAHSGGHFLRVDTTRALCTSLRYDLDSAPALGAAARFAVWARAAGPTTESVELVLWPGRQNDGGGEQAVDATARHSARFTVDQGQWRCLEAALPVAAPDVTFVRVELYFDSAAPVHIDLDEASIHFDGRPVCQGQPPRLTNPDFETGARHLGWSFLAENGCTWDVVTGRAGRAGDHSSSQSGSHLLRVERTTSECHSILQDVASAPVPGVTYRGRIWVRAAGPQPLRATLALRALGADSVVAHQRLVAGGQWRCVETVLTPDLDAYDSLRFELYFDTPDAAYLLDNAQIALGDQPLCPPQELLLNGGFEEGALGAAVAPWEQLKQCLVAAAEGAPHSGDRFARAQKGSACASIFQDVFAAGAEGAPGSTATLSAWVRAAGSTPARGLLALRANGDENAISELPFILTDDRWTCLETSLEIPAGDIEFWRPEIYFSTDRAVYDVDDVTLAFDASGNCPQANHAIGRLEWLPGTAGYPGSSVSGVVEIENLGEEATAWPHVLRYWLAETRNGPPLYDETVGTLTVPPLEAGAGSGPLYFDLALPPGLAAGKPYSLVMESGATSPALQATQRRRSLPLALKPCEVDSLFCDIPAGYWAQSEAEAWYTAGITSGCRSSTQPYLDLPFCPQQILSPDTMAVFLLRHLAGPGFNPAQPYRGLYADVPESHRRSLWIEALHDEIGPVTRSNCPQVAGELRFCPQAPLLRADLLRYLAAALGMQPAVGSKATYVDLAADRSLSALADAFAQAGVLPAGDPACPDLGLGPRFCPQEPARRIDAAVWMVRGFALQE